MANEEWIESEVENLAKRGERLPSAVIDILSESLKTDLHQDGLTGAGQTKLANELLTALREKHEVSHAD